MRKLGSSAILACACLVSCGGAGGDGTIGGFSDADLALVSIMPQHLESSVARNRVIQFVFNVDVDPDTVNDQSIQIRTGSTFTTRPTGRFDVSGAIVVFDPTVAANGAANAVGFPAGAQVAVDVPLFQSFRPQALVLRSMTGKPLMSASQNRISFVTGSGWLQDDNVPPVLEGVEFAPGPLPNGAIPADSTIIVTFSEPIDPASLHFNKNFFLVNVTPNHELEGETVASVTFLDGSLQRYFIQPVFGFGSGPFDMELTFFDPAGPGAFQGGEVPKDLAGNPVQNFQFVRRFATQPDPTSVDAFILEETFDTRDQEDRSFTGAAWATDLQFPGALVGAPLTTRTVNVDVKSLLSVGAQTFIANSAGPDPEGRYCPTANPLVGSGLTLPPAAPPISQGRRQMNLYRHEELGPGGVITRAAWGPDSDALFGGSYSRVQVRLGHKQAGTSLQGNSFFSNFDVDGFVTVADAPYSVPQRSDVNGPPRNDGFWDWPAFTRLFEYNGVDDLIVDIDATSGTTWQQFRTFVAMKTPGCTCTNFFGCADAAFGNRQADTTSGGNQANPRTTAPTFLNPGPMVNVAQFEIRQTITIAQSLYYDTGDSFPRYLEPLVFPVVQPGGAQVTLQFSGSLDGVFETVAFTDKITDLDGMRFIRFRVTMRANFFTVTRPRVEAVFIPIIRSS